MLIQGEWATYQAEFHLEPHSIMPCPGLKMNEIVSGLSPVFLEKEECSLRFDPRGRTKFTALTLNLTPCSLVKNARMESLTFSWDNTLHE